MKINCNRLIARSAIVALLGYVLSGPVAFLVVNLVSPQPAWQSPAVFAAHYEWIQDMPFYFGFLLIGGMLMLAVSLLLAYEGDDRRVKFFLFSGLGWTIVFCALIAFNYICQTTFVRNLALHYDPSHDAAIAAFSMSNPLSFCWANEMWGYGILGVANLFMAAYYRDKNKMIRGLLIANGIVSLGSVAWTIIDVSWVMTGAGLAGYFAWNVLMIVLMIMIILHARKNVNS